MVISKIVIISDRIGEVANRVIVGLNYWISDNGKIIIIDKFIFKNGKINKKSG